MVLVQDRLSIQSELQLPNLAPVQALDGSGIKAIRLVPKSRCQKITLPLVMYEFRKNIERDFMVWENKAYNEYPLLTEADGEILRFRRYCQQFYP